jgi:hypothetical protein
MKQQCLKKKGFKMIYKNMKLFHYTNIDSLAAILDSGKVKFNRLDKVNDLTEGYSDDFGSLAPYIFVSCWTAHKDENLALWNMYTKDFSGVRIKLDFPFFEGYNEKGCIVKPEMCFETNCLVLNYEPLTKVEYTNDKLSLSPNIKGDIGLELSKLARFKSDYWSIENEYRFVLIFIPIKETTVSENEIIQSAFSNLTENNYPKFDSYYLSFNEESLKSMEITLGPKMTYENEIIVNSLIDKYNSDAKIFKSNLSGKIR